MKLGTFLSFSHLTRIPHMYLGWKVPVLGAQGEQQLSGAFSPIAGRTYGQRGNLSTIVLTNSDGTLTAEAVSPEAVQLNIALAEIGVGNEKPGAKDTLGKNIEDGVSNNLTVNTNHTRTVSKTPNAALLLTLVICGIRGRLTWDRQSKG